MNALVEYELCKIENFFDKEGTKQDKYKITSMYEAVRTLRAMQALETKQKEYDTIASFEHGKIDAWHESETKSISNKKSFLASRLEEFYLQEKEKDPKFKISTPYGKVTSRNTLNWSYSDETAIRSLESMGLDELIRIKKELNKAELKKVLQPLENGRVINKDGEIVDGIMTQRVEKVNVAIVE